jgi:hypothetical protein
MTEDKDRDVRRGTGRGRATGNRDVRQGTEDGNKEQIPT